MNKEPEDIKVGKAYSSKENIGIHLLFVNNVLKDTRYFKMEDNQEVPCNPPQNETKYSLEFNLSSLGDQYKIEIKDIKNNQVLNTLEKIEELNVIDGFTLIIKSSEKHDWKKAIEPIEVFSEEDQEKLKKKIFPEYKDNGTSSPSLVNMDQVQRAVEAILAEQEHQFIPKFYKNVDSSQEFGVSRFVADKMAYLSRLLEEMKLSHIQDSTYLVTAEMKDSRGNSIKLEHRFKATTDQEAKKLYKKISSQLAGIQQKIWLACWCLANKLRRHIYSCQLTDLIKVTYPDHDSFFSGSEKTEFFEHLKSLEQTKILFSVPENKNSTKRKRNVMQTFEIPLLEIKGRKGGEEDKYPQQVTISIMSLFPNPGKMAFVGTPFKNQTLELHADDTSLAAWIQTRKAQRKDEQFILVERDFLIQLSRLQKTDASNRCMANKYLLMKLKRLAEKGIIKDPPTSINRMIHLKIR